MVDRLRKLEMLWRGHRAVRWATGLMFFFVVCALAQLNQSGGPGSNVSATQSGTWNVGLNAGSQTIGNVNQNGTWTVGINTAIPAGGNTIGAVSQNGTWNMTVNTALPAGANTIGNVNQNGTWNVGLSAGSNLIGSVYTVPKTACANTVASQALAAVPTSATAVFTATTCLMNIVLNNTTGSAATVTVSDNAGTPVNDVLTFSIPANSQLLQPLWGIAFSSGVKWTASVSGVTGGMIGYQ